MKTKHSSARGLLAKNIRLHRNQLGISQEKLAELCGLHRTYIGAVERAERNVSADNMEKIARALGVPLPELLSDQKTNETQHHVQFAGR